MNLTAFLFFLDASNAFVMLAYSKYGFEYDLKCIAKKSHVLEEGAGQNDFPCIPSE